MEQGQVLIIAVMRRYVGRSFQYQIVDEVDDAGAHKNEELKKEVKKEDKDSNQEEEKENWFIDK